MLEMLFIKIPSGKDLPLMKNIKNFVKRIIRKKNILFPKSYLAPRVDNLISKEIILIDEDGRDIFFGYHDRNPFHKEQRLVLSHRSNDNSLDVGYYDLDDSSINFNYISTSKAFSTQQGTMLQWDYLNDDSSLNFNTYANGKYKNISININNGIISSEIDIPLYCMSRNNEWALSCNFFHLAKKRPGYGIENQMAESEINSKTDGIWLINRITGDIEFLASYEILLKDLNLEHSNNIYINHLSFSPHGNLIVWFLIDENKERRKIYLQGMHLNGERKIINIESNRLMSHYCWIDDQTILGVNRSEDLTWKYTEYDLLTNSYFDLNINSGFDGHPMFSASSNKVIIDTTPDPNRFQHLLCFDRHKNKLFQIDKLLTSKYFQGQNRCDLHPRWNESSNMISVDTPIRNKRCQKIMILNQNVLQSL